MTIATWLRIARLIAECGRDDYGDLRALIARDCPRMRSRRRRSICRWRSPSAAISPLRYQQNLARREPATARVGGPAPPLRPALLLDETDPPLEWRTALLKWSSM